ncbi:OmpA family protein [Neolewinella persica]|uniref:OmpA family protein n=1 Tax=Neolewinella persica TaxID=70998 RepID=UPI000380104C|nr:OmpA family protein [Neolewinella persica]
MSNFIKLILMALAWGLFFLLTFYGCIKEEYCPADDGAAITAPAPAPVTDNYSIVSSYGSNDVLTGSLWQTELDALYAKFQQDPNQALEVTGRFYEGETAPAGYENMGFYRADEIKKLLVARGIPEGNIRTLSRLISGARPTGDDKFAAGNFGWGTMAVEGEPDKPELVEVSDTEIKIRFPFDQSTKTLGKEVEDYLKVLAERVKTSNETITIVGHTDNVDSDAYNMRLGQQRADFVKARLRTYGVDAGLISTSSKGESQPESSNATAEGRQLNRRAVVTLNKAQ